MTKANKGMSVFTMTMLTVAAVLSLRNLPTQADFGYSIIFYITAAAICFFVPSALISAELASGWPEDGGVYQWVKQAFGPKWGFVAIFMQWVENLPWFPMVLTFVAAALAYAFDMPGLSDNKYFVFGAIIVTLWLSTWLNFHGIKLSAFLSSSGALFGTVIPGILIILLAIWYFSAGNAPGDPLFAGEARAGTRQFRAARPADEHDGRPLRHGDVGRPRDRDAQSGQAVSEGDLHRNRAGDRTFDPRRARHRAGDSGEEHRPRRRRLPGVRPRCSPSFT